MLQIDPSKIIPCSFPKSKNFADLTNRKFDRLTVVGFLGGYKIRCGKTHYFWSCVCECGGKTVTRTANLLNKRTRSCGCIQKETISKIRKKHGQCGTKEYVSWQNMLKRCNDPSSSHYKYYGGRGIKVCDRWLHSFEHFIADMGACPDGFSIDRLNNSLGYFPENCAWRDDKSQMRNKRSNKLITHLGETLCVAEWCEKLNLPYNRVYQRLKAGWPVEMIFTEPPHNDGTSYDRPLASRTQPT